MIQFLVTAVIVVICLFLLVLLLCLMVWVISWVLRLLFPGKFHGVVKPAKKKTPSKKLKGERMEDRCVNCISFSKCPMVMGEVVYPCRFYAAQPSDAEE